ncbi:MAG TPA: hypothetical protein VFB62_21355 [Polyangiaceae bacterium]|nr:hypothetical protein [Polyangiaceae bacterium]
MMLVGAAKSILRSMMLAAAVMLFAGSLGGCGGDENDPMTHVDRLQDPMKRTAAVRRLIQFYEDAMTKDNKNREGENVKPLLDKIVEPLAKVAQSGELDERTQGDLLSFLSDTRDVRSVPALSKAIEEYRMDDKRAEKYDADMNDVVRNVGIMKAKEAGPAVLKLYQNMHASWPKAQNKLFYRTVHDAMINILDPGWEDALITMLDRPIKSLQQKEQRHVIDEVFWQATAAEVLGMLKSTKAVPALIKVVLSPFKVNAHTTAISALIKIGKPAIDAGVKLLNGSDAGLMKLAEEEYIRAAKDRDGKVEKKTEDEAKSAYVQSATLIVANIGRKECVDPLLAAIEKGDPATKAIIAGELYKLPADPKITEAFKKVWEETNLELSIPQGNAKEYLTESVEKYYDIELARWLMGKAGELKGEDAPYAQQSALGVALKLAGPADWPNVEKVSNIDITFPEKTKVGKAFEKELELVKKALDKCAEKSDCWIGELTASENQKESNQIVAIKGAYMAAATGGDGARAKLADQIANIENDAARFAAAAAVDRLAPKGDAAIADKLQAMIDKASEKKDEAKIKAYEPLKTVIYRLRARAE